MFTEWNSRYVNTSLSIFNFQSKDCNAVIIVNQLQGQKEFFYNWFWKTHTPGLATIIFHAQVKTFVVSEL